MSRYVKGQGRIWGNKRWLRCSEYNNPVRSDALKFCSAPVDWWGVWCRRALFRFYCVWCGAASLPSDHEPYFLLASEWSCGRGEAWELIKLRCGAAGWSGCCLLMVIKCLFCVKWLQHHQVHVNTDLLPDSIALGLAMSADIWKASLHRVI